MFEIYPTFIADWVPLAIWMRATIPRPTTILNTLDSLTFFRRPLSALVYALTAG